MKICGVQSPISSLPFHQYEAFTPTEFVFNKRDRGRTALVETIVEFGHTHELVVQISRKRT
jgi:hypothetical protein